MKAPTDNVIRFTSGTMKLEIHPSSKELGIAAANAAAAEIRRLGQHGAGIGVIFATGASQFLVCRGTRCRDSTWMNILGSTRIIQRRFAAIWVKN
jgi:hypothetical protein